MNAPVALKTPHVFNISKSSCKPVADKNPRLFQERSGRGRLRPGLEIKTEQNEAVTPHPFSLSHPALGISCLPERTSWHGLGLVSSNVGYFIVWKYCSEVLILRLVLPYSKHRNNIKSEKSHRACCQLHPLVLYGDAAIVISHICCQLLTRANVSYLFVKWKPSSLHPSVV